MRFTIQGAAPSWKNHRRIVTNPATGKRRTIKSDVCEKWIESAVFQLIDQRNAAAATNANWPGVARAVLQYPIREPVDIELVFYYRTKKRPDLDNAIGGPLDALQAAKILHNDNLVYSLTAMIYQAEESYCTIEIRRKGYR